MDTAGDHRSAPRAAAFFDLDKTILSTSSAVALRRPFMRAGLVSRRGAVIALLIHLPYLLRGADAAEMERMRRRLGDLARGWDPVTLETTVRDALTHFIDPVCHTEALDAIALHKAAGRPVVVASASVREMVQPIADLVGADFAVGSIAQRDAAGAFTGRIEPYNYGAEKAAACASLAREQGWELQHCWAYSDSVSDLPLLESVGHPVAVNPDRALERIARERSWEIQSFTHTVRVRAWPPSRRGRTARFRASGTTRSVVVAAALGAAVAAVALALGRALGQRGRRDPGASTAPR